MHGQALGALFLRFLLQPAQHAQRCGFDGAHDALATAMRAGHGRTGDDACAQSLARHFHQAELADPPDLDAGAILRHRIAQTLFDVAIVASVLHVDEVDDDETGEIAQTKLAAERGLLDGMLARGAAGVDVDGNQRLGLIDDDVAAGAQRHRGREHGIELGFDMVTLKQRHGLVVGLHVAHMAGHQHAHEVARVLITRIAFDDDLGDVLVVQIADGAFDEIALLVDVRGRIGIQRRLANRVPHAQQVFVVALDLDLGTVLAGGADDETHAFGQFQRLGRGLQALAVVRIGDLARDAAAARRIGHQHAIAAGKRKIGGERRTLVAALLLDDLHQDDLAALDDFLDLVVAPPEEALGGTLSLQGLGFALERLFRGRLHVGYLFGDFGLRRLDVHIRFLGDMGGRSGDGLFIGDAGGGLGVRHIVDFRIVRRMMDVVVVMRRRIGLVRIVDFVLIVVLTGNVAAMLEDFVAILGLFFDGALGFRPILGRQSVGGQLRLARGFRVLAIVVVFVAGVGLGCRRDLEGFDLVFLAPACFGVLLGDECLTVGDGNLVIVGMDFREGEEALAVAAILDEGRLQRRLYARDLGKIDVALERPL